jgi:serine/threonine protein kinase
MKPLRDK